MPSELFNDTVHVSQRTPAVVRPPALPCTDALVPRALLSLETRFFRDPKACLTPRKCLVAQLLCNKPSDLIFSAWMPACATGKQVYSFAILLYEIMREAPRAYDLHIFAKGFDKRAVAAARVGSYLRLNGEHVPARRLRHLFVKTQHGYKGKRAVQAKVVFSAQNVAGHLSTGLILLVAEA